jgi:hypothetical protein
MIGQSIQQKDDDEEVECIEDPAEDAGRNSETPARSACVEASRLEILFDVHTCPEG